jgi:Domain of unknown function (DUF1707)
VAIGPQDQAGADRSRLRAAHADREQAIEALKNAFVDGRLTIDELDAWTGRALTARTYAELTELTVGIPPAPAVPAVAQPPAQGRRWPLAKAAAGSSLCLVIVFFCRVLVGHFDPGGLGPNPHHSWAVPFFFLAFAAIVAALGILAAGVAVSVNQRRSRRRLPPRPGPGAHALDGRHDPVPTDPTRTDPTRTDLRAGKSRQNRRRIPARARYDAGITASPCA